MVGLWSEATVKRDVFPKLKRVLANVPFAEDVLAAYYCAFDPATPVKAKGILIGALAYFIMPVDMVPDFILGLGFTDDMAVLLADRVIVMSERPGRVIEDMAVPLPRPRTVETTSSKVMHDFSGHLRNLLLKRAA